VAAAVFEKVAIAHAARSPADAGAAVVSKAVVFGRLDGRLDVARASASAASFRKRTLSLRKSSM